VTCPLANRLPAYSSECAHVVRHIDANAPEIARYDHSRSVRCFSAERHHFPPSR
jgi:hypothetical protein